MASTPPPSQATMFDDSSPEQWIVITTADRRTGRETHRLRYGRSTHATETTLHGLERLREIARFQNLRDLKPIPRPTRSSNGAPTLFDQ